MLIITACLKRNARAAYSHVSAKKNKIRWRLEAKKESKTSNKNENRICSGKLVTVQF